VIANQIGDLKSHGLTTHDGVLPAARTRVGDSEFVGHPCAIGIPSADRPRKSDLRFPLSRAKRRDARDAGGGTRTPDTRIMIPLL
jgi:hypothetical protein